LESGFEVITENMSEYKFGELVKARLAELKMSQNQLAKRVHKGRSYINYVVSGKNRTAKNKQSKPGPESVELIARALGIPVDEALVAAGWPQFVGRESREQLVHDREPQKPSSVRSSSSSDKALLEIATKAALEAVRQFEITRAANEIRIDLPGKMKLTLDTGGEKLSDEFIDELKSAFRTAFDSVRQ
jgi:transcriptional regulator with XRE-family HTH domain